MGGRGKIYKRNGLEDWEWKGSNILASSMAWVEGRIPEQILASAKWTVADFICHSSKDWRTNLVRERFEWKDDNNILAMEIPSNEAEDFVYWKGSKSGKFTVRSGYNFLQNSLATDRRQIDQVIISVYSLDVEV